MNTPRRRRRARSATALAVGVALGLTGVVAPARAARMPASSARAEPAAPSVRPEQRAELLGPGWQSSADRAWVTSGDADGFHLLVADAAHGYTWRTAATLSEPGLTPDQWIGNACVTASGRKAVVVYAPRTFTNRAELFDRGAFTAVVDLASGAVTRLPIHTSLAYFNPGCGVGDEAVLTQGGDEDLGRTRLIRLDAATGELGARIEVPGQLTSPVPTSAGIVAADAGAVVRVDGHGARRVLARTSGVPFRLAADSDGGVVYMERTGRDQAAVRRAAVPRTLAAVTPATLTTGALAGLSVTSGRGGRVFVTGARTGTPSPAAAPSVSVTDVPAGARLSTTGRLAVTSVLTDSPDPRAPVADPTAPRPVNIAARSLTTGKAVTFAEVPTEAATASATEAATEAATEEATPMLAAGDPNNPADFAERYCSVPRNDPANQAMQPKPRQVEWAVDQAVRKSLTVSRPANWKNLGMPAYTPQGLFPSLDLVGGGYVPAQVMLGIAAQESNLWQAARFALPGVTANPLIGNYYGVDIYNDTSADDWTINWADADCGYGVTQVTDGMRLAGHEKPGETALAYQTQRAVALDFAANIAAGVRILQSKWNQVAGANLKINNGDPSRIENWFFAVWAYNSGFHADNHDGSPWGLGWANNPANPHYPANRNSFLQCTQTGGECYADAAHPQDWPYPEKIMGWAGHPINSLEAPDTPVAGYRAAWWNGGDTQGPINRWNVEPPHTQFCDTSNQCEPGASHVPNAPEVVGEPAGPCAHKNSAGQYDLQCWYHQSSTWKTDCDYSCGNELLRFDPGYAYQDDGNSYPPNCSLGSFPSNVQIIDDVPDGTPSIRSGCGRPWTNAGTFTLSFAQDSAGNYPGKIDTHQLGAGFGGHFWFTHTRTAAAEGGKLRVTGTWKFNQTELGYAKVLVHLPDLGAQTHLARYVVKTAYGDRVAVVSQPSGTNRWVSLGTYRFGGRPEVSLSSVTPDGDGSQDVAFDAAAVIPVPQLETVKVLHWNLAGAAKNHGEYDVVERLVSEIQARPPDVVSLNEICLRQFDRLVVRLDEIGYHMGGRFHASQLVVPNCQVDLDSRTSAGNAVLIRGTVTKTQGYVFDSTDPTTPDNTLQERMALPGESRSVACVTGVLAVTAWETKVCSTHLSQEQSDEPNPIREAEEQTRELARVFGPEARTMPFILAGDFNIPTPPANGSLAYLYPPAANTADWTNSGDFDEVDQERGCKTAIPCEIAQGGDFTQQGNNGQKIDYVFASRWYFNILFGRVEVVHDVGTCNGGGEAHPCSDHWLFRSEVQMQKNQA